jgi:hypothetical protein
MRTTFVERCLLNDASLMNNASFIWNVKEQGESKIEGERERIKSERQRVIEKGLQHGSLT